MGARPGAGAVGLLTSLKTSAALLVLLSLLLLLSVLLPQGSGITSATHDAWVARGGLARFLLVELELGHVPTSRVFLGTVGLFFVNLTAVLGQRTGIAVRRCRFAPPPAAALDGLVAAPGALRVPAADDVSERARVVLATLGYRVAEVPGGLWGVKNRWSPLGFPLFHLSFFVLWLGGSLLFYTRSVELVSAIEGQEVDTANAHVLKRAAAGRPAPLRLVVERVDVAIERGAPTGLSARVRVAGEGEARTVRVNAPLVVGDASVLVERAGVAPVLRIEDGRGFTVDRAAVTARADAGGGARASLAGGAVEVEIEPVVVGPDFPERDDLPRTAVTLRVRSADGSVREGRVRPGQAVVLPGGRVVVEELRYWVGLRVVRERGGGLLILGFVLGVAGIVVRMLWYRREVAVVVRGGEAIFAGRAEFFPDRFAVELATIAAEAAPGPTRAGTP